jgi:hypothetical protein
MLEKPINGTFASISQNNMERAGLRIAYQMISWVGETE